MKSAVVICGPIASGKSAAVAYVAAEFGLKTVSFGQYVRCVSQQAGDPRTRESLQEIGERLFNSKGALGLLQAALEYAGVKEHDSVVFDGVRHRDVLNEVRKSAESTVAVFLQVGLEERYRRHNARLSLGISLEEFKVVESHPVEVEINSLAELCDMVIDGGQQESKVYRSLKNHVSNLICT